MRCTGSSPRVRGTDDLYLLDWMALRFIPACAGNSSRTPPRTPRRAVHPRVCGEQSRWVSRRETSGGSSPRVRGRSEEHTSELQSLMRIAYAVFCLQNKKE